MAPGNTSLDKKTPQATPESIDNGESAEDFLMPDIYAEKHAATQPLLKTIDPTAPDIDASTGFNPYDTVVFLKKPALKPR